MHKCAPIDFSAFGSLFCFEEGGKSLSIAISEDRSKERCFVCIKHVEDFSLVSAKSNWDATSSKTPFLFCPSAITPKFPHADKLWRRDYCRHANNCGRTPPDPLPKEAEAWSWDVREAEREDRSCLHQILPCASKSNGLDGSNTNTEEYHLQQWFSSNESTGHRFSYYQLSVQGITASLLHSSTAQTPNTHLALHLPVLTKLGTLSPTPALPCAQQHSSGTTGLTPNTCALTRRAQITLTSSRRVLPHLLLPWVDSSHDFILLKEDNHCNIINFSQRSPRASDQQLETLKTFKTIPWLNHFSGYFNNTKGYTMA